MTDWQKALEAGINKAWGGNNATGYHGTVNIVVLVDYVLAEAGFVVLPAEDVVGRKSAEMAVRIMAAGARIDGSQEGRTDD